MKNKKPSSLMMLTLCGVLTACGPGAGYFKITDSQYKGLNGKIAKEVYKSLTTVGIGDLNYLKTSAAQNAQHFANFVDGLLTHNDFGTLELGLAESAEHNDGYTEFTFKVRSDENLYWSTYDGQPYKDKSGNIQYVVAKDFFTAAKVVNTFSVKSDVQYLQGDFIVGAQEYYYYTQVEYQANLGNDKFVKILASAAKTANYIQTEIQNNHPAVYQAMYDEAYGGTPLTADDVPNIKSGARLGVKYNEETNEVKYSLLSPAMYFPTMLTYSAYLPVNEDFYNEQKSSFGKVSRDSILYCGPYLLSGLDETLIEYTRNEAYMARKDVQHDYYKQARIKTIHYDIVKQEIDSTFIRDQFEHGNIDGFSLSPNDKEGWTKYVVGPNKKGQTGTIKEPLSGLVNSRWLDTIGDCYGTNLVLNRTKETTSKKSYSKVGTEETIANAERALRLQPVRKAILAAIDYKTYYTRYSNGVEDDIFATQRLVSTYVPKNFVMDDNGQEYTQEYYAQALANYKGISKAEAQKQIAVGQYDTRHISDQAKINEYLDEAEEAIDEYNANTELVAAYGAISKPVQLEYFSVWDADQETKTYDTAFINSMNKRLNRGQSTKTLFNIVPTDKVDSNNQSVVSGSDGGSYAAFDFSVVQWGWGADYGDPQTYMNTYTKGGDWSSVFAFIGQDECANIRYDDGGNLEVVDLLEEYTGLVNEGKALTDNLTERFSKFAEAEVKLIEELAIYLPQVNNGQGWSLSISNSAGYEMPTANYGLSDDRLTGMWVLKKPLTAKQRKSLREEQDAAKAAWLANHDSYNIYD